MRLRSNLSEAQEIACVDELVAQGRLIQKHANVYLWTVYGHPERGKVNRPEIAALAGYKKPREVRRVFAITEPLVLSAIQRKVQACQNASQGVALREIPSEEEMPLYFGITRQSGSDAWTTDDYVPKLVIDPLSETVAMPPHKGEEEQEQERLDNVRDVERERTVERMRKRREAA